MYLFIIDNSLSKKMTNNAMNMKDEIISLYNNNCITAQILIGFSIGVLISPLSGSLIYVLLISFLHDLYLSHTSKNYSMLIRIAVILSYLFGWLFGKIITTTDVILASKHTDKKYFGTRFTFINTL